MNKANAANKLTQKRVSQNIKMYSEYAVHTGIYFSNHYCWFAGEKKKTKQKKTS